MEKKSKLILYTALSGFISSIIFGLLFYGRNIFNIHDTRFQIILLGLFGSAVFVIMKYKGKKELFYTAIVCFVVMAIIRSKAISLNTILMDIIFIIAVFISIYYYELFIDKNGNIPFFLRAFVLMLLFGITNVIGVIVLMMIHKAEISVTYLLFYSRIPALVGLALGIGFDFFEKLKEKLLVI